MECNPCRPSSCVVEISASGNASYENMANSGIPRGVSSWNRWSSVGF
jgi:hypothetical protein